MLACGQTMAHWLHWMQLSMTHSGTADGDPRFSRLRGRHREDPIRRELGDRQLVALLARIGRMTVPDPTSGSFLPRCLDPRLRPGGRVLDLIRVATVASTGVVHGERAFSLLLPNTS